MSITVNTNMEALRIQENLSSATNKMNTAMERMSSGYKINSASDDAAGYAVSTKLSTTISCSKTASNNVSIGTNLLDTAAGTLDTISTNLSRIRDLTVEASNGTYSSTDLSAIATEVFQRISEINSAATTSTFNDIKLFDSKTTGTSGVNLQIGSASTDSLNLDKSLFKDVTASTIGLFQVSTTGDLQVLGSDGKTYESLYAAGSDTALQASQLSTALTTIFEGKAYTVPDSTGQTTSNAYGISSFLNDVDSGIANVTDRSTSIGAYENRLSSISDSLTVQQTNLTSALSTIKDADVAQESATYVQQQILQSASTTLLTQANSAPQIALTLIKG